MKRINTFSSKENRTRIFLSFFIARLKAEMLVGAHIRFFQISIRATNSGARNVIFATPFVRVAGTHDERH